MNIRNDRFINSMSGKRLKRARRLYARIIFPHVMGDRSLMVDLTRRVRERGLYSVKTSLPDVCMSLLSYLEKIDVTSTNGDWLFDNFGILYYHGCTHWFKYQKNQYWSK